MVTAPTADNVIAATAKYTGIPTEVLCNNTIMTRNVTYARHLAMYLAKQLSFRSHKDIGDTFGFSHPSVSYACRRILVDLHSKTRRDKTVKDVESITANLIRKG